MARSCRARSSKMPNARPRFGVRPRVHGQPGILSWQYHRQMGRWLRTRRNVRAHSLARDAECSRAHLGVWEIDHPDRAHAGEEFLRSSRGELRQTRTRSSTEAGRTTTSVGGLCAIWGARSGPPKSGRRNESRWDRHPLATHSEIARLRRQISRHDVVSGTNSILVG